RLRRCPTRRSSALAVSAGRSARDGGEERVRGDAEAAADGQDEPRDTKDGGASAGRPVAAREEAAAAEDPPAGEDAPVGEDGERGEDITVRDPVSAPDAQGRPRRTTRRFPLFTRDTARPEGGGRAA